MSEDLESELDEWPPKTVEGIIDAFFICAEKEDMDLIDEMPKNRIPWLTRNLDSLLIRISDPNSTDLRENLGDRNMNDEQTKERVTEEIWKYWHFQ